MELQTHPDTHLHSVVHMHLVINANIPLGDTQAMSKPSTADTLLLHSFKFKCVIFQDNFSWIHNTFEFTGFSVI